MSYEVPIGTRIDLTHLNVPRVQPAAPKRRTKSVRPQLRTSLELVGNRFRTIKHIPVVFA